MLKTVAVSALVVLAGCANVERAARFAADEGAEAADAALSGAEFVICRAATVGSVTRRYWSDAELREAWSALCLREATAPSSTP